MISKILLENKINFIFHAAAYKHVPIVENNPIPGLLNNVFSTRNICKLAKKFKVNKVILISSDKAVRPTNIMGASKRIAEQIIQCHAKESEHTIFSMVRFGNVLGSSGSVVPLFKKQIAKGGPITITDKKVIRYFMSISEAVKLVLEASSISKGGEVFSSKWENLFQY